MLLHYLVKFENPELIDCHTTKLYKRCFVNSCVCVCVCVQTFRGREEILSRVELYLSRPATDPLVLYGLSGSGKTSVLAKSASLVHHWFGGELPVVIVRFLG